MWYSRFYENKDNFFSVGKVNLIYGPRRVGKTALIGKIIDSYTGKKFTGEGDDIRLRQILGSNDKNIILSFLSGYDLIFIDEAQRISDIGWGLKILVDNLPGTIIIASGSSSFRLSSEVGAPLTGRSITNLLYPLSIIEIEGSFGAMQVHQNLDNYLVYGMYPNVLTSANNEEKANYLTELRNSYLLMDILELENVKSSDIITNLLRLLAYQIGKEVSLTELSSGLGIAKQTVSRYLDLLEKTFIIKRLDGFSRNLRKEITKTKRYYFYDNGIRNSIINNFNPVSQRDDTGALWENFIVMERIKKQSYHKILSNNYFWRTYDQKEVDWVEERNGRLYGYEFKWNPKRSKIQQEWLNTYPEASFEVINNSNYMEFLK